MRKSKGRALAMAMAVILVLVMSVVVGLAPPVMSVDGNTTDESNFALRNTNTTKEEWLPLRNDSSKEANWSYTKPMVPFEWNANSNELTPVIILLNTDAFVTGSDSAAGNTSFDMAKQEVSSILEADELQPMGLGTGRGGSRGKIKRDLRIIDAISADVPLSRMDTLNNSRAVKAIYPDRKVVVYALLANSVPLIHASDVWQLQDSEGNNVTGKGVLVAVLDTGVDYMHPDLGGGFGPEYKVVGGYDFVNEDSDPMDDNGHGTYVAGIVAANGNLKGVAPDANLLAYKVLGKDGRAYTADISVVIGWIDRAIEDDAKIISMSFGVDVFDRVTASLLDMAIDRATVSGVIVVAAAGNGGPGFNTIESPGSNERVITVGAVGTDRCIKFRNASIEVVSKNKTLDANTMLFSTLTNVTGELVYAELGYPENFSSSNFTGKIALIKRGILYFEEKVKNAHHAGAIGAVIFNNRTENRREIYILINKSDIPAVFISQKDGKYLLNLMNRTTVAVRLNQPLGIDYVSDFSSRGPDPEYMIKPDIVAPGYKINSTALYGRYNASCSGTSFAAPHASGACALLLQLHPDWAPGMIKAALMNNAKDIGYGVFKQGAGRVDVLKAATLEFIATTSSIGFYVMKPTSSNKKIKVENLQNYTIPVNVSVVREQGMYLNFTHININSTSFDGIKINVTPDFTLHPKENEQIDFTIHVPENYTTGYYCGKIVMKSDNHSISVPFALTLKKSTLPRIFPDVFSATPSAVRNAEAGKQLDPSESKKK